MSYLTQHRTRIRKRYNYSKGALESGMIIEMTYKKRAKKGDPSKLITKKYMALVLDPLYKGYMHAMSLEQISSSQLNTLAKQWGLTLVNKGSAIITSGILTGERIPKLLTATSATGTYSTLFSKLKGNFLTAYKTFNITNVGNIAVCDYEWDKSVFRSIPKIEEIKLKRQLESEREAKERKRKAELEAKKPTNK